MSEMKDFVLWFLTEIPDFLLTPPISLCVGFLVLSWVIALFWRLANLHH